jgi:hypothetical protein
MGKCQGSRIKKAATNDGNHNGRNSSRTKRTNHTKHNDASIITDSITNHVTRSIAITNKENQQARQRRGKPTRHQCRHATYGTSIIASLRQALLYLWRAACDRLNRRKEKKVERIKREVRRMGRNTKRFFTQPTFFTTLIIMMAFNQGTQNISVDAYTRRAPKLQPGQIIFKSTG